MPTLSLTRLPLRFLLAAIALGGLGGCSRVPAGVVPVSGRVTLEGEPLAGATVTFQPLPSSEEGELRVSGSVGRTDAAGRFTMRLVHPNAPGAVVGRHAVSITTATSSGGDADQPTGERVPAAWRNGSETFEVPAGGTGAANFDLQTD